MNATELDDTEASPPGQEKMRNPGLNDQDVVLMMLPAPVDSNMPVIIR